MIKPNTSENEPVTIVEPRTNAVPALFDSPHSGSNYPEDFNADLDHKILRRAEDAFVDELFSAAPDFGATLIAARFPRAYIDPNRSDLDVNPNSFENWKGHAEPSEKSRFGKGLIWTHLHGDTPLYNRKLSVAEVQARIKNYWVHYHGLIANTYNAHYNQFGHIYHVNCHSMRAMGNASDPDGKVERPDFVISDHEGKSCSGEFLDLVTSNLSDAGFNVAINNPYKGAELTQRYSDPEIGRHSLQIEINRRLYMDEMTIERSAGFENLHGHLTNLAKTVCAFAANT
jgi:N-formylglutamate deformylase